MAVASELCFDGIELSSCRTYAYARNGYNAGGLTWNDCSCCTDDWYLVNNGGDPYTDPETDGMPWVSAKEPESADWAGLIILNIEGLDLAPTDRDITQRINDGGQFGRQRRAPRQIQVTAVSLGRTCTAAWWGARWLNEQLRQPSCAGSDCGGVDLVYYLDCPDFRGSCLIPNSPSPIDTAVLPYKRTLYNVALTDGVNVSDQINLTRCCRSGCTLPIIQFTLTAADPWSYTDSISAVVNKSVFPCAGSGTCPTWFVVPDGETPADPCAETEACSNDAVCGVVPSPPDPPLLRDPCVCDPITLTTTCYTLDADDFSDLGQTVPVFTITAGTEDLRGLSVRFIPNDGGLLNACDTCFEINLPFLQARSTWTFDAARRETTIFCGGQTNFAVVTGEDGGPLDWPVFECVPTNYSMCVTLGCGTDVTGVVVNAGLVTRHG